MEPEQKHKQEQIQILKKNRKSGPSIVCNGNPAQGNQQYLVRKD